MKNTFQNFKYIFTESFIKERLTNKIKCTQEQNYFSSSDLIKLKKIMKKNIKDAIRIKLNFISDVPLKLKKKISNQFISCSSDYLLNTKENKIIFAGSLKKDLMEFLTELSIHAENKKITKTYPILESSIECFEFKEELFAEEWENKNSTSIDEETIKGYKEVSQSLSDIRDYIKTFCLLRKLELK